MELRVSHNMEVAHRLSLLPGKCQQIHGHSMQVHLSISGLYLDENGIAGGIDFGSLKHIFREYIDTTYDHHLHLNMTDPYAQPIFFHDGQGNTSEQQFLPGLITHPGDPTVENLAKWIARDMASKVGTLIIYGSAGDIYVTVTIEETKTNGAVWSEVFRYAGQ